MEFSTYIQRSYVYMFRLKVGKYEIHLTYKFLVGVKNRGGHWYEHLVVSSAAVIALCLGANAFDNKMNMTKWLPLLSFSIKSLLCCSLCVLLCHLRLLGDERGEKNKLRVYVRNAIHTKVRPKCEFPAFCEADRVAAGDRRQQPPEENYVGFFFSLHGFYCQKALNHSLRNTKDVQWERPMARSAQTVFFSSPFFLFSLLWLAEKALSGI